MTKIRIAALLAIGLLLIAGCKATVRGTTNTDGGTVTVTWETAPRLTGTLPIGRWMCYSGVPALSKLATSNTSRSSKACYPVISGVHTGDHAATEWRADGTGYVMTRHWAEGPYGTRDEHEGVSFREPPEGAFRISGSNLLYSREDELRWTLAGGFLTVQTTREKRWRAEQITSDVFRLCSTSNQVRCNIPQYMIRIGSSDYEKMHAFRECVENNGGKPLFEVKECSLPFPLEPDEG